MIAFYFGLLYGAAGFILTRAWNVYHIRSARLLFNKNPESRHRVFDPDRIPTISTPVGSLFWPVIFAHLYLIKPQVDRLDAYAVSLAERHHGDKRIEK